MKKSSAKKNAFRGVYFWFFASLLFLAVVLFFTFPKLFDNRVPYVRSVEMVKNGKRKEAVPFLPPLDTAAYDKKINELANNPPPPPPLP